MLLQQLKDRHYNAAVLVPELLAENIIELRKQRHLTRKQLAGACGVPVSLIANVERKIASPEEIATLQRAVSS